MPLALAGALARSPRLLISDESTAMIDRAGRAEMLDLLASLPARGIAVVHITHDPAESARADRVVTIRSGRIVSDRRTGEGAFLIDEVGDPPVSPSPGASVGSQRPSAGVPALINADHLWADRVAHTYDLTRYDWDHIAQQTYAVYLQTIQRKKTTKQTCV